MKIKKATKRVLGTADDDKESVNPPQPMEEPAPPGDQPSSQAASPQKTDRITIPLTAEGRVDWSSMRDSTKSKLRAAMGESTPAASAASEDLRAAIPMLWSLVAMTGGLALSLGAPDDIKRQIVVSMALSPDELAVLENPTRAVLAKYLPGLSGWETEAAFLLAIVGVFGPKVANVAAIKAAAKAKGADGGERGE